MKHHLLLISSDMVRPAIPPVGLEYIAEFLLGRGYDVDLIDMCLEENPEKIIKRKIQDNCYSAVGVGIRIMGRDALGGWGSMGDNFLPGFKNLISKIKKMTKAPVVLGGASFSLEPNKILKYTGADYGVEGCGIPALEILLKKIKKKEVKPGTIFGYNPKKYLDFSFKRRLLNLKRYPGYYQYSKGVGVNTKNGCWLNCFYCPYIKIGEKLMLRNPLKVVQEIENLISRGIAKIFFADEIFNVPKEHSWEICNKIIRKKLEIKWSAILSPFKKDLPENLIKSMIKSGLAVARFRIGSGSDKILKNLGRNYTTKDIEYTTDALKRRGILVLWVLIFGVPGETKKTIDESFELVDKLSPNEVVIQIGLRIYKSTKFGKFIKMSSGSSFEPAFYPFKLGDYVIREKLKRKNCHFAVFEK